MLHFAHYIIYHLVSVLTKGMSLKDVELITPFFNDIKKGLKKIESVDGDIFAATVRCSLLLVELGMSGDKATVLGVQMARNIAKVCLHTSLLQGFLVC